MVSNSVLIFINRTVTVQANTPKPDGSSRRSVTVDRGRLYTDLRYSLWNSFRNSQQQQTIADHRSVWTQDEDFSA